MIDRFQKMLSKAIEATVNEYLTAFMETVSDRYQISFDELVDLWTEVQKSKPTRRSAIKKSSSSSSASGKKPKRLNAYQVFCKEQRPLLADEGLSFIEMSKELSRRWKGLSVEEKQKYPPQEIIQEVVASSDMEDVVPPSPKKKTSSKKKQKPVSEESEDNDDDTELKSSPKKKKAKASSKKKKIVQQEEDDAQDEFLGRLYPVNTNDFLTSPPRVEQERNMDDDETEELTPLVMKTKKIVEEEDEDENSPKKNNKRPKTTKSTFTFKMPTNFSEREEALYEEFSKMKKDELKEECDKAGIKTGSKQEMILGLVRVTAALDTSGLSHMYDFDDSEI